MTETVPQFSPYLIHNTHMPHAAGTHTAYSPYTSCSLWNSDHINIDQHLKHLSWSYLKVVPLLIVCPWAVSTCAFMYANVCDSVTQQKTENHQITPGGVSRWVVIATLDTVNITFTARHYGRCFLLEVTFGLFYQKVMTLAKLWLAIFNKTKRRESGLVVMLFTPVMFLREGFFLKVNS